MWWGGAGDDAVEADADDSSQLGERSRASLMGAPRATGGVRLGERSGVLAPDAWLGDWLAGVVVSESGCSCCSCNSGDAPLSRPAGRGG